MTSGWYGIWSDGGIYPVDLELINNKITGQGVNSIYLSNGSLSGTNNEIGPTDAWTVTHSNSQMAFSGNDLNKGRLGSVKTGYYTHPDLGVDLTNNYWGTADPDSISAWIWDGVDDPELQTTVQFEPFLTSPVPAERKSMGGLKSLFR